MLKTEVTMFGKSRLAVCDRVCEKAWGVNGRRIVSPNGATPSIEYDEDDDVVYLADSEVDNAPDDPGTYEGGHGKPMHPSRHNKWCVRECERCSIIDIGEEIAYADYSTRRYNQPWLHPEAAEHNKEIKTGEIYHGPAESEYYGA